MTVQKVAFLALPSDVLNLVAQNLDSTSALAQASKDTYQQVEEARFGGPIPASLDSQISNGSQPDLQIAHRKRKADELLQRVTAMPNGDYDVEQDTEKGKISRYDLTAQRRLAHTLNDAKAVAYVAFIKQTSEGRAFLAGLDKKENPTLYKRAIVGWVKEHQEEIRALEQVIIPRVVQKNLSSLYQAKPTRGNKLLRRFPSQLELVGLRELNVANNLLTDLPDHLARSSLEILHLQGNLFRKVPSVIGEIPTLTDLDFSSIGSLDFSDDCPIWKARNLHILDLSHNETLAISSRIGNLSHLQTLALSGNRLHDLPKELSQIPHLQILRLDGNQFVAMPQVLHAMPRLRVIYMVDSPVLATEQLAGYLKTVAALKPENLKIHLDLRHRDGLQATVEEINRSGVTHCDVKVIEDQLQVCLFPYIDPNAETQPMDWGLSLNPDERGGAGPIEPPVEAN